MCTTRSSASEGRPLTVWRLPLGSDLGGAQPWRCRPPASDFTGPRARGGRPEVARERCEACGSRVLWLRDGRARLGFGRQTVLYAGAGVFLRKPMLRVPSPSTTQAQAPESRCPQLRDLIADVGKAFQTGFAPLPERPSERPPVDLPRLARRVPSLTLQRVASLPCAHMWEESCYYQGRLCMPRKASCPAAFLRRSALPSRRCRPSSSEVSPAARTCCTSAQRR